MVQMSMKDMEVFYQSQEMLHSPLYLQINHHNLQQYGFYMSRKYFILGLRGPV